MARLCSRLLAGTFLGVLAVLLLASPASAHAILERTTPLQGTVVPTAPTEVVLTFSEQVRPVADKIRITGPDGKRADTGKPQTKDRELHIPLQSGGPKGTYLVSYRVISADSHPIAGGFSYSLVETSATPNQSTDAGVATSPTVAFAVAAARYLGFAGLILLAGPTLVLFALWPRRLSTRGPARLAMIGVLLSTVGALAELYLEIPYTSGTGLFGVTSAATREVMGTPFASAHLIRVGVLAAITVLLRPVINGRAGRVDQTLLIILGLIGLATWPISGHPSSSPVPTLTVVADVAHLASMSIWLGGLIVLFGYVLRQANDKELTAILPVWSGWAMFAVTVLVLAGTAQALVEIGTLKALTGTTYGQLVLVKVGLLVLVLCVAAFSRRLVNTRFVVPEPARVAVPVGGGAPPPEEPAQEEPDLAVPRQRLRMGVLAEVAIAAVVLGVTAALVQTTPARTAEANANPPAQPFSVTLTSTLYRLEVDIAPAGVGTNTIHLYAFNLQGTSQPVVEWGGTAALPSAGIEPVSIPLLALTPDHASGQILLPNAGTWELRFTLRTDDIHQASVTAKVPVR